MKFRFRPWFLVPLIQLIPLKEVEGGMPMPTLGDFVRPVDYSLSIPMSQRLDSISFFLAGFLLSAGAICWAWNSLRVDFPRLPRLTYRRSIALLFLWGLAFMIVLTMISGARELLTPGAWEKQGLTYRLVKNPDTPINREIDARISAISKLRDAILEMTPKDKRFPKSLEDLPEAVRSTPLANGEREPFVLKGGDRGPEGAYRIIAHEGPALGRDRLSINAYGEIRWISVDDHSNERESK